MSRKRLDQLLIERGLASDAHGAQALVLSGAVLVANQRVDKPGTMIEASAELRIRQGPKYVSRGGLKLEGALRELSIEVEGLTCLDLGASTGGFTDCLLKHGAAKVYSVDVGYGQLAWELRQDDRVVVMERTNARYLTREDLAEPVDLAVIDASFISLQLLIPPLLPLFRKNVSILALIKPQFEVGRDKVGKGGVVRDADLHQGVIDRIVDFCHTIGLKSCGVTPSPILGPKGNREFLIHLISQTDAP